MGETVFLCEYIVFVFLLKERFIVTFVVSIEFSPLGTVELTTNWYQLHNGDYC